MWGAHSCLLRCTLLLMVMWVSLPSPYQACFLDILSIALLALRYNVSHLVTNLTLIDRGHSRQLEDGELGACITFHSIQPGYAPKYDDMYFKLIYAHILSTCIGGGWQGTLTVVQDPCSFVTGDGAWGGSWQELMEGKCQVPFWVMAWITHAADSNVQLPGEKLSAVVWGTARRCKVNDCAFCIKGKAGRSCHSRWAASQQVGLVWPHGVLELVKPSQSLR